MLLFYQPNSIKKPPLSFIKSACGNGIILIMERSLCDELAYRFVEPFKGNSIIREHHLPNARPTVAI